MSIRSKFYTEERHLFKNNSRPPDEWTRVCSGHDELEEAVECFELHRAVILGDQKALRDDFGTALLAFGINKIFEQMRKDGVDVQLRIVKLTIEKTVAEAAETIVPVKERKIER
jgi:hypothetical protein